MNSNRLVTFSEPSPPARRSADRDVRGVPGAAFCGQGCPRSAFSLIEIIVVMALLSIIILGLLAMFTQTQRAFRTGMTQADVLESGRIFSDMISRELAQITPANQSNVLNFAVSLVDRQPLYLPLPGATHRRTNLLQDLFFVYRHNQEWVGVGYFVRTNDPATGKLGWPLVGQAGTLSAGAGTLYRFETNLFALSGRGVADLYRDFYAAAYRDAWPVAKLADGVVHFKVRAYDTAGRWIQWPLTNAPGQAYEARTLVPGETGQYLFYSNVVPATVELEVGILEDRAWKHFEALPSQLSRYNYLTGQVGRVHLFRERVAVRNVDPVAYQ